MPAYRMPRQPKTYIKILEAALPLFAAYGYKGVAMRDIAQAVGITAAALYNHFPNKEQLHLKALEFAFSQKVGDLSACLEGTANIKERFSRFILYWVESFGSDVVIRSLLQREMADADPVRVNLLVEHVFKPVFDEMSEWAVLSSSRLDSHLLFVSVLGLIMYHFEITPMRKLLPGYLEGQDDAQQLTEHIMALLEKGLCFDS